MMGFMEAARLFEDCWKVYRKYFGRRLSESEWDELTEATSDICKKYNSQSFACDLLLAVISEIERINKAIKEEKK
ncbi:MAG: hypothetical protein PHQ72_12185 [Hespellia sp.]|nr:hypothetical protein [Hespellia sp.]